MSRFRSLSALAAACLPGLVLAQQDPTLLEKSLERSYEKDKAARAAASPVGPGEVARWNPGHMVLFKGTIKGIMNSAPQGDGKSYVTLLVKLSNGGTAMVELGPKDYVDAQGLYLRMNSQIWVAGSKSWVNPNDSVILAQRVNYDGDRPSFRRADGTPFWVK